MTEELLEILKKGLVSLEKSLKLLKRSFEKCKKIGLKSEYSDSELDSFEALIARFSRQIALLQKFFCLIDSLELVDEGTLIDRINRAEKRDIISSAKDFTDVCLLRNLIAHEYKPDEYTRIFSEVLKSSPFLIDCVEKMETYCMKFFR